MTPRSISTEPAGAGGSGLRIRTLWLLACSSIALALLPGSAGAQTCSCAGVPILGAMESASPKSKQWFLASTYEYHDLSELVAGSSTVDDETGRDRTAQALIVELSRGLTEKWSLSALLSAVRHERDIGERDTVSGVGDAIFMAKFSPSTISLYRKTTVTLGIGARLPIGEDDARSQGVVLAEDLQPSTGAYGSIVWLYAARALNDSRGLRAYVSATHTHNGDNAREYQFGHSTTAGVGGSYQTQTPWGFSIELAYRHADRDRRANVDIPNTGGQWLDIIPAVQYHINPMLALRAAAKIPVARDLNDELQFTTRYAIRLSLSYLFGGS